MLLLVYPAVTNTSMPPENSKPSTTQPIIWDSEFKIPESPFMLPNFPKLPYMMLSFPLLLFIMALLPSPPFMTESHLNQLKTLLK